MKINNEIFKLIIDDDVIQLYMDVLIKGPEQNVLRPINVITVDSRKTYFKAINYITQLIVELEKIRFANTKTTEYENVLGALGSIFCSLIDSIEKECENFSWYKDLRDFNITVGS